MTLGSSEAGSAVVGGRGAEDAERSMSDGFAVICDSSDCKYVVVKDACELKYWVACEMFSREAMRVE